jgi:site-specific DNA recombinase
VHTETEHFCLLIADTGMSFLSAVSRFPFLHDQDHVQTLLAAPELVARTWVVAKREGDEITEREVTVLLADFATVWSELFPAEQARIVQLLVERVDVQEDALEVRIRAEGLASLVGELRQQGERMAA